MVCACFADIEQVCPGHVHGAQCEFLSDRVDVGGFVNHGRVNAAEDAVDPFWSALLAGDEALGSKLLLKISRCRDMGSKYALWSCWLMKACWARACEKVTHNSGLRVHRPTQRVDGDDMRSLLVPRTVFAPIARRDFLPRVIEVNRLLEVLHFEIGVPVVRDWYGCALFFNTRRGVVMAVWMGLARGVSLARVWG